MIDSQLKIIKKRLCVTSDQWLQKGLKNNFDQHKATFIKLDLDLLI